MREEKETGKRIWYWIIAIVVVLLLVWWWTNADDDTNILAPGTEETEDIGNYYRQDAPINRSDVFSVPVVKQV